MSVLSECAAAASLLSKLEPITGAALAINLAYLNLERFRYRSKIRDHAREKMRTLAPDPKTAPPKLSNNKWFKQVDRLAALKNHDAVLPADRNIQNGTMPEGFWPFMYHYLFERHQDRWASFVFATIALFALIGGVAHELGHWSWAKCWFSNGGEIVAFYVLVLSLVAPVFLVWFGSRVVRWGTHYATDCVEELEKLFQEDVAEAKIDSQALQVTPVGQ